MHGSLLHTLTQTHLGLLHGCSYSVFLIPMAISNFQTDFREMLIVQLLWLEPAPACIIRHAADVGHCLVCSWALAFHHL
jgi:hypothetical protein